MKQRIHPCAVTNVLSLKIVESCQHCDKQVSQLLANTVEAPRVKFRLQLFHKMESYRCLRAFCYISCLFLYYRPVALAWEVRKTSPGKLHLSNKDPASPSPADPLLPEDINKTRPDGSQNSWADLVKGR